MKNDAVFKKNPDMVERKIDDETILVPIFKASEELNCIYTLNKPAARIWEMIDGRNTLADIKVKALREFDTSPQEVSTELASLIKDLREIKAVI